MNQKKVVVITGASSGIGKALVLEYANKGHIVAMAARNEAELKGLQHELLAQSRESMYVVTDVTKESDCQHLIDAVVKKYQRIDILINNAGISMRALFNELDLSVMKRVMDVNFWGTVYCSKYALPYLLETKGSLVGVISIAGYLGLPARSAYSASKFAIRGFLDTIRVENLKKDLHVLVAAPGFTKSNIRNVALTNDGSVQGESPRDENKMMTAEEVAQKIVKAVERKRSELILTFVEGKLSVFLSKFLPRLLDRLSYNHMAKEPNSPLNQ